MQVFKTPEYAEAHGGLDNTKIVEPSGDIPQIRGDSSYDPQASHDMYCFDMLQDCALVSDPSPRVCPGLSSHATRHHLHMQCRS